MPRGARDTIGGSVSVAFASVSLPTLTLAAFALITVALVLLWAPAMLPWRGARLAWTVPGAAAVTAAYGAGVVDVRGLGIVLLLTAACVAASQTHRHPPAAALHVLVLSLCAALFLHVVPGFDNPRVIDRELVSAGAQPYTKFLNFDKAAATLLLLGLYAPDRTANDRGFRHPGMGLIGFAGVSGAAMIAGIALDLLAWDPKVPSWWGVWLWSMVFFTALPEEALFRGVVQESLARRFRATPHGHVIAIVGAGLLFGVAHVAGGPGYVLLACIAGIGYSWVYAATGSLAAATLTHAGLNTVHLLLFTYPASRW